MKRVKVIIGIAVVLLFTFIYAHIGKANVIYDKSIDNSKYIATGVLADTVEQEFVCKENTMDGVTLKCQLLGNAEGTSVKLSIVDNETGKTAAKSEVEATDMKNSKFNVFSFETVKGCKGKSYTVVLEGVNFNLEAGNGIGLVYEPSTEKHTKLTINGSETQGTLIAKTITDRFDIETFFVLIIFILYIVFFVKFLYKLFK